MIAAARPAFDAFMSRGEAFLRVVDMRIENRSRTPSLGQITAFLLALPVLGSAAAPAQGPGWVGLSTVRSQYFVNEDLLFFVPEPSDGFGAALATGDFNGDGADDLATGVPFDNGLGVTDMGIVIVRYGVPHSGLEIGLADTVLSKYNGAFWDPIEGDRFGSALAAGDFDGDGFDDLAVGTPGNGPGCGAENCPGDYGMVFIYYGASSGIAPAWLHWIGDGHGGWGATASDRFGSTLAAGNFNGDSFDDLAIGAPNYAYGILNPSRPDAGGVWVVEGGPSGMPTPQTMFFIGQVEAGIPEDSEAGDKFGFALAAGNFNGDTQSIGNEVFDFDDLAIGIPGEDGVGAVLVIYGSQFNLLFGSSVFLGEFDLGLTERWSQASIYGNGFARDFDHFGQALAALRFDPHWDAVGDPYGISSLVVGTPGMSNYFGGVTVVRGTTTGLGPAHKVTLIGSDYGAAPDNFQENQSFGGVLATGDFDGNGHEDLVLGHQQRAVNGIPGAGAELVLYSSTFADGFDRLGDPFDWSIVQP